MNIFVGNVLIDLEIWLNMIVEVWLVVDVLLDFLVEVSYVVSLIIVGWYGWWCVGFGESFW